MRDEESAKLSVPVKRPSILRWTGNPDGLSGSSTTGRPGGPATRHLMPWVLPAHVNLWEHGVLWALGLAPRVRSTARGIAPAGARILRAAAGAVSGGAPASAPPAAPPVLGFPAPV